MGGEKALVPLGGTPLIAHPLRAARAAGLRAVLAAKRSTRLPTLAAAVLLEPEEPHHPLCGVVAALRVHPAVIAIPCDMPFVTPALLVALAQSTGDAAAGTIDGRLQPFPSLYTSATLPLLETAVAAHSSIRSTLETLNVLTLDATEFGDPDRTYMTVNSPEDLARAAAMI